jgi:hypothetical protein
MRIKLTGKKILMILLPVVSILLGVYFLYPPAYPEITYPEGKKFAFSIVDDTDNSTLANTKPVYDLIEQLDMRTTKTVWVLPSKDTGLWANRGECLQDSAYREFILDLQAEGFEIALHGVRGGNSKREEIIPALEYYKAVLGDYPKININHAVNTDNLYWGEEKFGYNPIKFVYSWFFPNKMYSGSVPGSEYFWGDVVQKYITYVVNFSFYDINLLKINPDMPYQDPDKPYVNYWFHTSDGGYVTSFNKLISRENIDRLEQEGGVCLVYTHLARDFYSGDSLNAEFKERMEYLASKDGWFVPAGEILDFLREQKKGKEVLSFREKIRLDIIWIYQKILHGSS